MNISNNTILITCGTSGIGLGLAKALLHKNNVVIVTGRDAEKLKKLKTQYPAIDTIHSDIRRISDIDSLFTQVTTRFPETNIMINNAGIMKKLNLQKPGEDLEKVTEEIESNLIAQIRMATKFMRFLIAKDKAAIINNTSGLAFVPLPIWPVYCAAKAGLHSFTLSLRVQLKDTSIKVFELAPPATKTPLLDQSDPNDLKGVPIMPVEDMVAKALEGIQNDRYEIRPGQSNQLKMMSRLAPDFILKQMSRSVDRMLRG